MKRSSGYLNPDFRLPTHRQYALEDGKISIIVGGTFLDCTLDSHDYRNVRIVDVTDERGRSVTLKPALQEYIECLLECGEHDARRAFERAHNTILLDVVELAW